MRRRLVLELTPMEASAVWLLIASAVTEASAAGNAGREVAAFRRVATRLEALMRTPAPPPSVLVPATTAKAQLVADASGLDAEWATVVEALNRSVAAIADPSDRAAVANCLVRVYNIGHEQWAVMGAAVDARNAGDK